MSRIEFTCRDTGLQAFVNAEHCRQHIRDKHRFAAYECRFCHWFHIGIRETCPATGKRSYLSKAACEREIEQAWIDPEWKGILHHRMPRRAYLCSHCKGWHMSTRSRSMEELAADGHVDPDLISPDECATIVV